VLARRLWGQGIVAEAARVVVDTAFRDPDVYRVWAVCDVENRASARVMEKVGMTHEGVLRKWILHPNISPYPRDVLCYARIRSDGGAA
jgi:RimJ/RimL family protein N-acetyltransferase